MGATPTETAHKRWIDYGFGTELKSGKAWAFFFGRLALGFLFLWSAYGKIQTEMSGRLATADFLRKSVSGPFTGFFNSLSGNLAVEYLLVYGEFLIGVALIFGIFTRVASVSGMLMMLLFTIALWPIADTPTANPLVDFRVIYAVMFLGFFFLRPGRFLGGDGFLQKSKFLNDRPTLRAFVSKLG
ncbi:MAG: DoxX family protein [Thermoplasmata archaeon]